MTLSEDDIELVRTMLGIGPVLMYADRLATDAAPARFLSTPNVRHLLGCRPADVGQLFDELGRLVAPEHRARLAEVRALSVARQPVLAELQLNVDDGLRWWRIESEALGDTMMMGFLHDITESVEAAAAEQAARAEAEQSRDRALAANRAKTEFLSRMSHELRTPLNSIVGFGQLLELQELGPPERDWVDSVVVAGKHLLALIDEVLDVVGIESGRLEVSLEPVDVGAAADEAIALLAASAQEWGVTVRRDGAEPVWAIGDHHRVLQILLNLIENAIRYNRDGGSVVVTAETVADRTILEVVDTGPGITEEQQARVFQPFDRLGVERTGIEGTGMGLTLSRALAEHMHGSLDLTSVRGEGTTLRLALPAGRPATVRSVAPGASGGSERGDGDAAADRSLTILYIEDNVANLRLMESVLELRPATTLITAMRGNLGFEIARDQHPDLVLVDLHLPDTDGREVVRRLREEPATSHLAVAVVSADATPGRIDEMRDLGADYYLTKPIDIHELISIVDDHIERKWAERGEAG